MSDTTLYEALGGRDAIEAVVDRFYERVITDEQLAPYFEDVDDEELRKHQAAFLTYVTGGADEYDGRSMEAAHAGLGITAADFAAVAEHLQATLAEFDVPEEHADEVMAAVADLEPAIAGA